METLFNLDEWLFFCVNRTLSNPVFDCVMPFLREKLFWIPFYVFLVFWSRAQLSMKRFHILFLCIIMSVTLADTLSSKVIKPWFLRERPCNSTEIEPRVIERVPCGVGYSFTSSHAANHFALIICLFCAFGSLSKKYRWLLFLWACSICFAQIYVGVHYPSDVIAGAILGALCAYVVMRLAQPFFQEN